VVYRLFVILFACIAASLAAGFVVTLAVLIPEVGNLALDRFERSVLGYVVAFGAIFVSFFAFLPALIVIALGEILGVRAALYYAVAGAVVGAVAYMSASSWNTLALTVDGFARRELEIMAGAGIAAGFVYWAIAGRNAGRWREPRLQREPDPL
jgi:phosphotransferase system  glucose/maltose/N-acetylglucosamine-specific IIC component